MTTQKKEIVETMLRGFLSGNAPGSSLTAFEELSLVPRRERECWVALMQPLRWKQGEEPWELSLLSTAVGNMEQRGVHAAAGAQCNGGRSLRSSVSFWCCKAGWGSRWRQTISPGS